MLTALAVSHVRFHDTRTELLELIMGIYLKTRLLSFGSFHPLQCALSGGDMVVRQKSDPGKCRQCHYV